jgi:hypothetical protein
MRSFLVYLTLNIIFSVASGPFLKTMGHALTGVGHYEAHMAPMGLATLFT